ncbi:MAG: leucyl aminopeptidase [Sandaracinaceae bacterium]
MMKVTLSTDAPEAAKVDLLALAVRSDELRSDPRLTALDDATEGALREQIALEDFKAKKGESLRAAVRGLGAKQVLLIGMGEQEPSPSVARLTAAIAGRAAATFSSVAIVAPSDDADVLRALASGLGLGSYKYTEYLTADRRPSRRVSSARILIEKRAAAARRAVGDGLSLAECVNLARDLVNAPPNDLSPRALADIATAQAKQLKDQGVDCKVWDKKGIERLKMQLFLAVNRGSAEEPRLIHVSYRPKARGKLKKVVFVGKGLTFDSGGLCLKPPKPMLDMKCDMGGAATTLGTVLAAARLGLKVEVHGLIGSTENMTGAAAYRPGDVYRSRSGKTVEIINTDAEGRLVLADVLDYAQTLKPDILVDHATLTGAAIVALGPFTSALYTADEELAAAYLDAAGAEGESYWRMPLDDDLREGLRSDIADLKHTGDRAGGSIIAALFLREFVGDHRWVHLDIAGPAFLDRVKGVAPKGGTGFGVMTAVRFLESL